jgi:hypothetical protein
MKQFDQMSKMMKMMQGQEEKTENDGEWKAECQTECQEWNKQSQNRKS